MDPEVPRRLKRGRIGGLVGGIHRRVGIRAAVVVMIITQVSLVPVWAQRPRLARQVRSLVETRDFVAARKALEEAKPATTPAQWLEAYSWLGRGYLAAGDFTTAGNEAQSTRRQALALLEGRRLDDEPALPIALGAAVEVQAQTLHATGRRAEAVAFLNEEIRRWQGTSIVTRLRKNLNLISLTGKPAPSLEVSRFVGPQPPSLGSLKGRPVLLFFWAHWCGDCKAQAGVLARLAREHPKLALLAPTQLYGYAAGGEEAEPQAELRYIDGVREKYYGAIAGMTVPLSAAAFEVWGASTTPTLALLDEQGVVRLYHPGRMSYEELSAALGH